MNCEAHEWRCPRVGLLLSTAVVVISVLMHLALPAAHLDDFNRSLKWVPWFLPFILFAVSGTICSIVHTDGQIGGMLLIAAAVGIWFGWTQRVQDVSIMMMIEKTTGRLIPNDYGLLDQLTHVVSVAMAVLCSVISIHHLCTLHTCRIGPARKDEE